jgi:hypothetical protein
MYDENKSEVHVRLDKVEQPAVQAVLVQRAALERVRPVAVAPALGVCYRLVDCRPPDDFLHQPIAAKEKYKDEKIMQHNLMNSPRVLTTRAFTRCQTQNIFAHNVLSVA